MGDNLEVIKRREDLQGIKEWNRNFEDITWMCKQVLNNMIGICACYQLEDVVHTVLKALERFLMQLCFTINQACSRKMHQGLVNPLNQAATAGEIDQALC